jgi:hypothetical protein
MVDIPHKRSIPKSGEEGSKKQKTSIYLVTGLDIPLSLHDQDPLLGINYLIPICKNKNLRVLYLKKSPFPELAIPPNSPYTESCFDIDPSNNFQEIFDSFKLFIAQIDLLIGERKKLNESPDTSMITGAEILEEKKEIKSVQNKRSGKKNPKPEKQREKQQEKQPELIITEESIQITQILKSLKDQSHGLLQKIYPHLTQAFTLLGQERASTTSGIEDIANENDYKIIVIFYIARYFCVVLQQDLA